MTAKTHMIGGVLAGELVSMVLFEGDPSASAVCLIMAVAGSVMPDIDCVGSKESYESPQMTLASAAIEAVFGHRGFFHTPFAALLFGFVLFLSSVFGYKNGISLTAGTLSGIFSHLILDSLNAGGIMWLYPFRKRRYHWARIRIDSLQEAFLAVAMFAGAVLLTARFLDMFPGILSFIG